MITQNIMKNEQIFEIEVLENEPHNSHIFVQYELEGVTKFTYVPYPVFAEFMASENIVPDLNVEGMNIKMSKFEEDDIYRLSDNALKDYVHQYLFKSLRVDLIIKNRKLEDKIKALEEENQNLKAAFKCHFNILNILIKSYSNFKNEAKDYLTNPMHLGKFTMCDSIIRDLQDESDFIQKHI